MALDGSDLVYGPDWVAADLIVSTPWWHTILAEESTWHGRASRTLQAVQLQATAFFDAARDMLKAFSAPSLPPRAGAIVQVATSCAAQFRAMGNTFLLIGVLIQRVLDTHDLTVLLQKQSEDHFLREAQTGQLNLLIEVAKHECMSAGNYFEDRFPKLREAIGITV
jgi:hypothetical protein